MFTAICESCQDHNGVTCQTLTTESKARRLWRRGSCAQAYNKNVTGDCPDHSLVWRHCSLMQKHSKGCLPSSCLYSLELLPPVLSILLAKDYCFKISYIILLALLLKLGVCVSPLDTHVVHYGRNLPIAVLLTNVFINLWRICCGGWRIQ